MSDEWMPVIKLALSREQFHQLPRNAAYKYEYINGQAYLTPRPKHYHALLDLRSFLKDAPADALEPTALRQARVEDFTALVPLFAAAFQRIQPFGSLEHDKRQEAARQALERVRTGGDGPWIERASFVALEPESGRPLGAIS